MPELTPHQIKALDFGHSISLKANAGSGKTSVLSNRYLQIAVEGNVSLQKIAAITFTDKAAGELYQRIANEINSMMQTISDQTVINKLQNIRRQLVSANISTIHSFCINILREFPVEAELDANFTPIDQNMSRELLELSIEETLRERIEQSPNDEIKHLIRLFDSKNNLTKQILKLIENRKIVLTLEALIYNKSVDEIADYFRDSFKKYFKIIYSPQVEILAKELSEINDRVMSDNPKNELSEIVKDSIGKLNIDIETEEIIKVIDELINQIFTKSLTLKKREYFKTELRNGFASEIENVEKIISYLSRITIDKDAAKIEKQLAITGKRLLNIFNDTMFLYNQKKKDSAYIDYEDILIKTKKILQSENVIQFLNEKYSYLMVDEYQDTNELQYDIFMPILDYLQTGNLFVVGDEKQSIYRFRDAELEVFNKTNKDISNVSGKEYLLTLPDSFRMDPALCLFANKLFRNLFKEPNDLFNEVEHTDIVCAKENTDLGSISIMLAEKDSEDSEARIVAHQIINLLNKKTNKIDWKDIAILVRKRSWFRELEKEFTKFRIPYRIVGGRGFYQRQSIYDVYNYFSFLLDIHNDAALVGILRSPFFTLSDAEIFELSLSQGFSYWEKLIIKAKDESKYYEIKERIRGNIELAGRLDFNSLLRKILEESEFISVLASRQDGEQELANIDKLLKITNSFSNQGFKTLYDYVTFLKDAINKLEDEAQAGLTDISNAVNLLTLHQAKGLEFPVVFLYKCDESSRNETTKSKSINIDKAFGLLTKVPAGDDYFSDYKSAPITTISDYIEERKNLAEVKRLFYVGVTRAKNHLFISATSSRNEIYNPASFMGLLYEGLKISSGSNEIILEDKLTFLVKENSNYRNDLKQLSIKIPIKREVEITNEKVKVETEKINSKNFLITKINDRTEGEIISATKVSTYSQCPLKYKLIYKFGYSELYSEFKNFQRNKAFSPDYTVYSKEDEKLNDESEKPTFRADVKGALIHKALQEEVKSDKVQSFFDKELTISYSHIIDSEERKASLIKEASELLVKFYNSKEFEDLKRFHDFKNEFEVYIRENDHFLYGIIDKLIKEKNKFIIIDYKTDNIKQSEIIERANLYMNQLKFYIYIISKLYKNISEFEARIIFLKYPDNPFMINYLKEDLTAIDQEINSIIKGILAEDFSKNISHCMRCNFSINTKCII